LGKVVSNNAALRGASQAPASSPHPGRAIFMPFKKALNKEFSCYSLCKDGK
jgi:hypothetical protein